MKPFCTHCVRHNFRVYVYVKINANNVVSKCYNNNNNNDNNNKKVKLIFSFQTIICSTIKVTQKSRLVQIHFEAYELLK